MKRLFAFFVLFMFFALPVYAQNRSESVTCVDVIFDNDPTSADCTVFIGDKKKVTLLLNAVMDWTNSDPDLSLSLKVEVGPSKTGTFYDVDNIIDKTGIDTPVTSPISLPLSAGDTDTTHEKQWYLPEGFTAQYLKLTLTATNSDANDTIDADLYIQTQE
jgi:hypothetical protein